jgi:hypothetical protein
MEVVVAKEEIFIERRLKATMRFAGRDRSGRAVSNRPRPKRSSEPARSRRMRLSWLNGFAIQTAAGATSGAGRENLEELE